MLCRDSQQESEPTGLAGFTFNLLPLVQTPFVQSHFYKIFYAFLNLSTKKGQSLRVFNLKALMFRKTMIK